MAEEWYVVGPGIQQDTTSQGVRLYIQYKCTWNNCNGVNVRWDYYDSSTSSWIYGNTSTEAKETTVYYDVPQNVTQVRVELVPQPTTVNGAPAFGGGNITHVFNVGDWSIPGKGDAPEISISKDVELKLVLDNIAQTPTPVEGVMFEVYKKEHNEQQGSLYQKINAAVYNGHAEATVTVTYGTEFTAKSVYYNHRNNFDADGFPTNGTASDPTQPIKSAPLPVEGFGITYQIISAGAMLNLTMTWTENVDANEYEIQYTNYDYDWALVEKVQSITTDQHSYILQLQNGGHYRFRIRAKNDAGNSSWYETDKSFGLAPLAPTTWTDVTRKLNDGSFTLYWKHNSRDSTREIKAELVIRPENEPEKTITISRQNQDEKDWYKNNVYELDTRFYLTSTTVFWKVRTCGESGEYGEWSIEKEIQIYAQPGIQSWLQNDTTYVNFPLGVTTATQYPFTICSRLYEAIEPYHKSKLLFKDGYIDEDDDPWWPVVEDDASGNFVLPLQKYPYLLTVQTTGLPAWADIRIIFYDFAGRKVNASSWSSTDGVWINAYDAQQFSAEVRVTDGQTHTRQELSNLITFIVTSDTNITQKLTEYVLNIKAVNDHTASDLTLNDVAVKAGDIVYSRNIPITEDSVTTTLQNEISIDDVMLTKNQQYKYELTAWFVSGASATSVGTFTFAPNSAATVNYEVEVYGIYNQEEKSYKLYVDVENDDLDKNFKVYVFRREHDYTYTTVVDGITGFSGYVIDSHPRLDKSMYFITVIGKSSGKRWNIVHQDKEYTQLFPVIQWGRSLYPEINPTTYELKLNQDDLIELLYNIDVNESRSRTSETSVYAGRVDPVSYYGESLSNTQTWNCEIPADDYKTLDKLRVLSTHNGPCYVRTPKGENYWSNIGVTITNTHNEVIRKVSLTITKIWSDKP